MSQNAYDNRPGIPAEIWQTDGLSVASRKKNKWALQAASMVREVLYKSVQEAIMAQLCQNKSARIVTLRDIDSPQNYSAFFKTDFFFFLTLFFSEGILQVFCGLCFSYIGALNSCKCASYQCKTILFVIRKSSDFKLFFL